MRRTTGSRFGTGRQRRFGGAAWLPAVLLTVTALTAAGAGGPAASAQTAAPAVDAAALAARDVLATVPFGIRQTCAVGDPTSPSIAASYGPAAAAMTATLGCSPDAVDHVLYDRFTDNAAMQAAFDDHFSDPDVPSGFDTCPSRTPYKTGRTSAGVVACRYEGSDDGGGDDGIDPGTALLAFTYAPTSTLVWVIDDDVDAVWAFFEDDAGPLRVPDYDQIAPVPTADGLLDSANRLGTHLPKPARRTCIPITDLTGESLASLYPYRLAIVADVEECRFRGGIEAEYVQFASAASANHLLGLHDFSGSERVARYKTFSCPGEGRYKGGRWGCYVSNRDADAQASAEQYATVVWTDTRLATYAFGTALAADGRRLLQWFVDEAGPSA